MESGCVCVEICTWCTESIVRALLAAIGNLTESTKGGRLFWDTFCHMHIIHGCVSAPVFFFSVGLIYMRSSGKGHVFALAKNLSAASSRFTARQDLWVLVGSAGNRIEFSLHYIWVCTTWPVSAQTISFICKSIYLDIPLQLSTKYSHYLINCYKRDWKFQCKNNQYLFLPFWCRIKIHTYIKCQSFLWKFFFSALTYWLAC